MFGDLLALENQIDRKIEHKLGRKFVGLKSLGFGASRLVGIL